MEARGGVGSIATAPLAAVTGRFAPKTGGGGEAVPEAAGISAAAETAQFAAQEMAQSA